MNMKFVVNISTNKEDGKKLDIAIERPKRVAKKWGALALLTHAGILKGLQEAYKLANGELRDGTENNTGQE